MRTISAVVLAIGATVSSPVAAQQFGRMTAANWAVFETDEGNRCAMSREFAGPGDSQLTVFFNADGTGSLLVDNGEWSIKSGDTFELFIRVGSVEKVGQATGFRPSFRGGFVIGIPDETFLDVLAGGRGIQFWRKNGEDWLQIDGLQLNGSAEAVRLLRQCLRQMRARVAREDAARRRIEHIPRDPFARPAPSTPTPPAPQTRPGFADVVRGVGTAPSAQPQTGATATVIPPTPARQISGSVTGADYPATALAAGTQGTTRVSINVGTSGLVTGCSVTGSSGSSALDSVSCSLIQSRFRYQPATRNGQPVESTVSRSLNWILPNAPDPAPPSVRRPVVPHPFQPLLPGAEAAEAPATPALPLPE